jgi:hypothetical protein
MLKPEKFNGSMCLQTFIAQFENCARHNKWNSETKAAHLINSVTGSAGVALWDEGDPSQDTYDQLITRLTNRFGTVGQEVKHQAELRNRRRASNETLQALYQDIKHMMALAYPREKSKCKEAMAVDAFLAALGDAKFEQSTRA